MKRMFVLTSLAILMLSTQALPYEVSISGNISLDDGITGVSVNPDTDRAAAISGKTNSLYIIDTLSGEIIERVSLDTPPTDVAIDTRRNRAVVVSSVGTISFVDLEEGEVIGSFATDGKIHAVTIGHNGNTALMGTDKGILVLDLEKGEVTNRISLSGHVAEIAGLDGRAVVYGSAANPAAVDSRFIQVVDVVTGDILSEASPRGEISNIAVDKESGIILASITEGDMLFYDFDLNPVSELNLSDLFPSGCQLAGLAVNPATHVAVSSDRLNNSILIMDVEQKSFIKAVPFYPEPESVSIDPSRNIALIAHKAGIAVVNLENPVPTMDRLVPNSAESGDPGFALAIEGSKFVKGSQTWFNEKDISTRFVSNEKLFADVPSENLTCPGEVPVTVTNPVPGGGTSNVMPFKIYEPAPVLESVSPDNVAAGSTVTIRARGKNFFNGSTVNINGENLKTRFISSILLEAELTGKQTGKQGEYPVVVLNPAPRRLTSNLKYLAVVAKVSPVSRSSALDSAQSEALKQKGSLRGRILNTHLVPIEGVTLKIRNLRAVTNAEGFFFLEDVPEGRQLLLMDASTARQTGAHYPTIPVYVDIQPGIVNEMPFQPYFHKQKNRNFAPINPAQETVLTDPEVPGFELRIPKGVNIIGWDGRPNLKVSVRTVPTDRLPVKPLPDNAFVRTVYMFYFNKIGGGTAEHPIPLKAPNDLGLLPGEKAILWYFDESPIDGEAPNDWAIAGTGTVTPDGKYIVSDPGVGIPKFCCGAAAWGGSSAGDEKTGPEDSCGQAGDPVDLSTGYFIHEKSDYKVPGVIPVELKRFYRSGDNGYGAYGKGTYFGYDWWLGVYTDMLLLLKPGNYQYRFYKQPDGTYINTSDPGYRGAVFYRNTNNTYTLKERNGWSYKFGTDRLLDEIMDPYGNSVRFLKEIDGNISTIILPDGRTINMTYVIGSRDNMTSITGPLGTVTYSYYSTGKAGKLKSVKYPDGSMISYEYDSSGRMFKVFENGKLVVTNEYDVNNRVIQQTHSDGGAYIFNYTVAGGNITETSMTAPNTGVTTWRFYTDAGEYRDGYIVKKTTPDGPYIYNREAETNLLLSVTDPLGRTKSYTYYPNGLLETVTDNLENVTYYEYESVYGLPSKIRDPRLNETTLTYTYDANDRITNVVIKDPLLNPTTVNYNSYGLPSSIVDAESNTTTFEYDAARPSELTGITNPLGNSVSMDYDPRGKLVTFTDANLKSTHYRYYSSGRLSEIENPLGGVTRFYYYSTGALGMFMDAKYHGVSYEIDDMDRPVKMTDQLGRTEAYAWDTSDNLTSFTDRKGQTTAYEHDLMNRLTKATYDDGTYTAYVYDAAGRLLSVTDYDSQDAVLWYNSFTYSDAGCGTGCGGASDKIIEEVNPLGKVNYTYDAAGRRTSMTVEGQPAVEYEYDQNGRLTKVYQTIGGNTREFKIGYDTLGRRTSLQTPLYLSQGEWQHLAASYDYDSAGRLTNISHQSPAAVIEDLVYGYDANGNRTSIMSNAVQPLRDEVTSASYDEANHLLQFNEALDSSDMTYDENGNLLALTNACGTTTYSWDARNRLVGITGYDPACAPLSASFSYDALGRRIEKTINGRTIQYLYDRLDIVQEMENGVPKVNYIRTLKIDEPLARIEADGTVRYYVADALGSVIALTDENGVVKTGYAYDPYGNVTASGELSDNPFQYTGRENDGTGLYYYRARYYSAWLQRFISEDPIGLAGGVNFYSYASNSPVNYVDPLGLFRWPWELYSEGHRETDKRYPRAQGWRQHNDEADAFRHCYTSCIASVEYGEFAASLLGWANEVKGDLFQNQPACERDMDEFNNAQGRYFGRTTPGDWSCSSKCSVAATSGRLWNSP